MNQTSYSSLGGKHRRNIFTGHETRIYAHFLQFATFSEGVLITEQFPSFHPQKVQLIMTLVLTFFFGMFVPIKHIFSSQQELPELFEKEKDKETFEFYVRRPGKLTPRRPSNISPIPPPVLINYRKGDVRRAEKSQNCIINVKPLDIVETANKMVNYITQNFSRRMTRITVHAEVHELPRVE